MNPWVETWGFDLSTAAGYDAWREAGGLWPDETLDRLLAYAEAEEVSAAINEELGIEEGDDHEEAA
ncbi:hypothetical protein WMF38_56905 [Sorangium sp. So ce118]